jgi:hypothetical protein
MHFSEPWKGSFPSLNPLPIQAHSLEPNCGLPIGPYPGPIFLPSDWLPSVSPGRWKQYISPKRRHRPTY